SHRVRRIVGKEMHARHERIGGDDEIAACRWRERSRIILEVESTRMLRQRTEIALDQPILAGSGRVVAHGAQRRVAANSPARHWRAMWSSTALTSPVSCLSTKACAISTYSETITRAGTSLRCSSS